MIDSRKSMNRGSPKLGCVIRATLCVVDDLTLADDEGRLGYHLGLAFDSSRVRAATGMLGVAAGRPFDCLRNSATSVSTDASSGPAAWTIVSFSRMAQRS